jgi:hypothetical protein
MMLARGAKVSATMVASLSRPRKSTKPAKIMIAAPSPPDPPGAAPPE